MKNFHKISLLIFFCFALIIFNNSNSYTDPINTSNSDFNVVPPAYSNLPGTATFLGPLANSPRSYQLLIHANQITALINSRINSFTFRIPVSATADWPATPVTFTNFDVYLSGCVDPVNRSLTFVNNVVGPQTLVRSGVLIIDSASFKSGATPNEFGMEIELDSGWIYESGNLLIELRHTGFTGTSRSVDAIGTAIPGYGTDFSACWQSSYTPTTGLQGNFAVTRINSDMLVGISNNNEIPDSYKLEQNYPNPFNPKTVIRYSIANTSEVKIKVYDILGNEVKTLVNSKQNAGSYETEFDGSELSSGVYIAKLTSGNYSTQIKMILNK